MKKSAYLLAFVLTVFMVAESYASIQLNTLSLTKFVRSTGEPKTDTKTFSGIGGPAKIKLINGDLSDKKAEKVSSAEIKVNDVLVFGPSDFNQNVSNLEKDINLQDGQNTLSVLLKGKPGGTVSIQINQILDNLEISPPEIILQGAGAMAQITLTGELSNGRVIDITNSSYGITCSSNNPYVASVSASGLVTAISGGETNILVTNGQYTANIPAKVEVMQSTQIVGPGGGTLEFHNGIVLEIPAGAVDTQIGITIKDLSYAEVNPVLQSNEITPKYFAGGFEGKPDGLIFNVPITVTIPVGPRQDSGDLPLLFVVDMAEGTYTLANTQLRYDPVTSMVSVEIPHFTTWAVAYSEHLVATVDCNSPDINIRCRCWGWVYSGELHEDIDVVVSGTTECYRKIATGTAMFDNCPGDPIETWTFREWENPKITFTPLSPIKLHPQETVSVTATVANAEGTVIPGASVSWENPQSETVSINPTSGKTISIKAEHAGTAHVYAKTGCNYQDKIIVEVTELVDKLEVHASPMIPPFNYPTQLNVVAKNPQGHVIQIEGQYITWSSNRPSPQPANFSSYHGLATTLTVSELGDITVYATYQKDQVEVTGSLTLCVHKRIASIEILPASQTLYVGQPPVSLTATPNALDGSSDLGCGFSPALTWNSTNEAVALVDTHGKVTAYAVGQTTISATVTNGSAHGEASICVDIGPRSIQPAYRTVIVGGTVPFNIYPASAQSPVISWNVDLPSIASLSLTQPDLTSKVSIVGNSPGEAHITASTGVTGSQTVCRDSAPATVRVLDMNGIWHSYEPWESSSCPGGPTYEVTDWAVYQTGSHLYKYGGAFSFSGGITGRTYSYTLDFPAYLGSAVMEYVYESGTVSNDGFSYTGWLSWTASYYDENNVKQYCSGTTAVNGVRSSMP
jgi:uncharacterized protein YjdB